MNFPILLHQIFENTTKKYPDNIALEIPSTSKQQSPFKLTYSELNYLANILATQLLKYLDKKEHIFAIACPRNHPILYIAQLAVLKAGGAYTCIDSLWPEKRVSQIIEDSNPGIILYHPEQENIEFSHLKKFNLIEFFQNYYFEGKILKKDIKFESLNFEISAEQLAYIIYTSGTTGNPKGVMIEHKSIVNLVSSDIEYFKLNENERIAQMSSVAYDSSLEEIYMAFSIGATLVVMDDEVVRLGPDLVEWLNGNRISVLTPPPTLLRTLNCKNPEEELPYLKLLYVGGEPLTQDIVDVWSEGKKLVNGYGPTETTVTITRAQVEIGKQISIGKPVSGNKAIILDQKMEESSEGELFISGISLARGYLNKPEITKEKFIDHSKFGRVYKTGDLVKKDNEGNLIYLGRADAQIKLRGYRIELEEIETRLMNYPGIDQVLCSVQGEGSNAVLVAFIVTGSDLKENKINKYLKKYLPEYMLPGIYYNIDKLPVNTGGKLDRKLLPLVVSNDNNNELEDIDFESDDLLTFIKSVVSKHLKKDIRPEDDFFNKGGNSLLAALIISDLRKNPKTSSLAVRDIYKLKTINKLYDKIINSENSNSLQKQKIQKSGLKSYPTLVTIFQGIWILLGIGIVSNFSYLFFYYLLPWLFSKLGIYLFLFSLPVILYSLGYLAFVVNVSLATIFKKLLIGKYKEGRYPIWGSYYLKHWIVQTFLKWLPWNMIEGTGVFNFVLKILGARIGKGVYIHRGIVCFNGALDKLEIGDNVTIGRDVALQTISYESQEMVVGSVKIGSNSNISLRASLFPNSSVGENSEIKELSVIFSDQNIPDNEKWSGIPAKLESKNDKIKRIEDLSEGTFTFYSLISRLFLFYLSYFPFIIFSILAITYFKNEYKNISNLSSFNPLENIYQIILISIMEVVGIIFTFFWNAFLCKNLFKIQYGDHSCFSFSMIKAWSKETWIQTSGYWLSGSLFWPLWLKLSGMKIGPKTEISTIMETIPELVEVEGYCFFADGIYLGASEIKNGNILFKNTKLGKEVFIGNHAIIEAGLQIPGNCLIGVSTIAEQKYLKEGSSWFGLPSFELPKREIIHYDERFTFNPTFVQFINRLFWEGSRFLFPVVPTIVGLYWIYYLFQLESSLGKYYFFIIGVPGLTILYGLILSLITFINKWLLIGKMKKGEHPLWSCWCSRWDFVYVMWRIFARPFMRYLEDTKILQCWLRLMGVEIGKNVALFGEFSQVVDPDMLHFKDNSTVTCLFQAHSFEDRVLKLDNIYIEKGASVNFRSILFYGAKVSENTRVLSHSVVMKNESLNKSTIYAGSPIERIMELN